MHSQVPDQRERRGKEAKEQGRGIKGEEEKEGVMEKEKEKLLEREKERKNKVDFILESTSSPIMDKLLG